MFILTCCYKIDLKKDLRNEAFVNNGLGNDLAPKRTNADRTNANLLLNRPPGTNLHEEFTKTFFQENAFKTVIYKSFAILFNLNMLKGT